MNELLENKKYYKFIYFVMTIIATFSVSQSIIGGYNFQFNQSLIVLLSIVFVSFMFVLFYRFRVGVILFSIIISLTVLFSIATTYIETLRNSIPIGDGFSWFAKYLFNNEPITKHVSSYIEILCVFIIAIVSILFYFILFRKEYFIATMGVSIAAFWFHTSELYLIESKFKNDFSFYLFVFSVVVFFFLNIYKKKDLNSNNSFVNPIKYFKFALLLSLILLIIIYLMPKPEMSLKIPQWVDDKYFQLSEYFRNSIERINFIKPIGKFNLSSTGYSINDKKLGGAIKQDNTKALLIKSNKDIYLKGTVKDTYDGNIWRSSQNKELNFDDNKNPIKIDLLERNFSQFLIPDNKNALNNIWRTDEVSIKYNRIVTTSIFYPLKTFDIRYIEPKSYDALVNLDSTLLSKNLCPSSFIYKASYFDINYDNLNTIKMLNNSYKGIYENYFKSAKISFDKNSLDLLKENARENYNKYTQMPNSMPARVAELAQQLTKDKKSNFDKIKTIEAFLALNYDYKTDINKVPEDRDFVDYFLFDSKMGYCTYYASAMTIMVRSIGLPARYVEGYRVQKTDEMKDEQGFVPVVNTEGHSWVEVYFEGIGWISFEPTSIFYQPVYTIISDKKNIYDEDFSSDINRNYSNRNVTINLNNNTNSPTQKVDNTDGNLKATPNIVVVKVTQVPSVINQTPIPINNTAKNSNGNTLNILFILAQVLFVILVVSFISISLGWLIFNNKKTKWIISSIESMNNKKAVLIIFNYYFKVLTILGFSIKTGETAAEFLKRLLNEDILTRLPLEKVFNVFIEARYGNADISDEDKKAVMDFYSELIIVAKHHLGTFKFYFNRIILGKI